MALVETAVEGRVAVVTLNRPEALNAANSALLGELLAALPRACLERRRGRHRAHRCWQVVCRRGGHRRDAPVHAQPGARVRRAGAGSVTSLIEHVPQPTIAAVNGFALGGGCELALACDIRLAASNARFGQPEINLGIMPGWGGTQRLARICGPGFARELLFTGRMCDAEEALKWGLVNASYPKEELMAKATEMAATIAGKSRVALENIKLATLRALDQDLAGGLRMEADLFGMCFSTEDQTEGMDAFLGKRPPAFRHR